MDKLELVRWVSYRTKAPFDEAAVAVDACIEGMRMGLEEDGFLCLHKMFKITIRQREPMVRMSPMKGGEETCYFRPTFYIQPYVELRRAISRRYKRLGLRPIFWRLTAR